MKLILDTSVLIAFYTELRMEHLLLSLRKHGFEILVPEYILREEMKSDLDRLHKAVRNNEIDTLSQAPNEDIQTLKDRFPSLNRGELEVMWWGMHFKKCNETYSAVIDDGKARKCAQKLKIEITGTLGLIEILNDLEILSKKEKAIICRTLRSKGFRMPSDYKC